MSSTALYRPTNPSHLSTSTTSSTATPFFVAAQKKKTMSITQTYYLAHKARAKLSSEAARSDHNLRLLVGHANLLDSLMMELADAEREQESWFNQSVRGATRSEERERHIQWADTVVEDPAEDWQAEDADSDSDSSDDDYQEDDIEMADVVVSLRQTPATITKVAAQVTVHEEMDEDDLEEDYAHLELVRTHSHSSSPPELVDHDSDSSDDEAMPPSPPNAVLTFSEKDAKHQEQQEDDDHHSFYSEGFYLPPRNPARLVSAISVY
jgi:hypothetical protein